MKGHFTSYELVYRAFWIEERRKKIDLPGLHNQLRQNMQHHNTHGKEIASSWSMPSIACSPPRLSLIVPLEKWSKSRYHNLVYPRHELLSIMSNGWLWRKISRRKFEEKILEKCCRFACMMSRSRMFHVSTFPLPSYLLLLDGRSLCTESTMKVSFFPRERPLRQS